LVQVGLKVVQLDRKKNEEPDLWKPAWKPPKGAMTGDVHIIFRVTTQLVQCKPSYLWVESWNGGYPLVIKAGRKRPTYDLCFPVFLWKPPCIMRDLPFLPFFDYWKVTCWVIFGVETSRFVWTIFSRVESWAACHRTRETAVHLVGESNGSSEII
jgi:hypothetical protein